METVWHETVKLNVYDFDFDFGYFDFFSLVWMYVECLTCLNIYVKLIETVNFVWMYM